MAIVDKYWFTGAKGCVGVVKCTHENESGYHYYIGVASGIDEKIDSEWIESWGARFPREAGVALFGKEVVIAPQPVGYDKSHGSPWDRGSADSYYGRPKDPHWYPNGTGNGQKITDLTAEQLAAYHAGYDQNELENNKKDWG